MAAGDLVVADWQLELRTTLTGATTVYKIRHISGLGEPPVKARDVALDGQDGSYAAPDYRGPRIILVEYLISNATATAAFNSLTTLKTAWAPAIADIPLFARVPGWGRFSVQGRPRGLDEDVRHSQINRGLISVVGEFHALSPTITFG